MARILDVLVKVSFKIYFCAGEGNAAYMPRYNWKTKNVGNSLLAGEICSFRRSLIYFT